MRFKTVVFIISLLFLQNSSLFARNYWGLRNINSRAPDSVYEGFNADYYCYPISWARTERQDDQFTWTALDNSLDFAQQYDGVAVLVVSCNSSWACDGEERAPNDLDRRTPFNEDPPDNGYSESLYDFTYQLVNHFAQRDDPVVKYLRFVNEPEYNWVVGRDWEHDVEDYVRCLRTFYIAAHAAAEENEIDILVSHGGFYLVRSLARDYYRMGEDNEEMQGYLITQLQSRLERHSTRIRSWQDVEQLAFGRGGMPPTYWSDIIAGQTDWLDWFDIHYHWKPRFLVDDMVAFMRVVTDSGGNSRLPWLASEAAMQLAQGGMTEYEERFHAADMTRKWIYGMTVLEGVCTPMTGFPPEHFFGLFDDQQQEYLSATSYRFLRSIIHPLHEPLDIQVLDEREVITYRFSEEAGDIDVIWYDALFDTDTSVFSYLPIIPEDFEAGYIYNIFGEQLAQIDPNDLDTLYITQEPIIITWNFEVESGAPLESSPPSQYVINIYPNPFNSHFTIKYYLNKLSQVSIKLYAITGIEVWTTNNSTQSIGNHEVTVDGSTLPSGIYFVKMITGHSVETRKVALIR